MPGAAPQHAAPLLDAIGTRFVGHDDVVDVLLTGLLAQGHVLIEGVPGVGKTTLANAMADAMGLQFTRIQLTPDLLPADLVGHTYWNPPTNSFETRKGPVFTNILMADEINRTPPRTQAALLEVMQERQVTIEGTTYPVPEPFLVIATKNPIEIEGVYGIPEAELDRFMLHTTISYPQANDERRLLRFKMQTPTPPPAAVAKSFDQLRQQAQQVTVHDDIQDYIVAIAHATRNHPDIELGASPRANEHLQGASRAAAALDARDHVIPDDIKRLAPNVYGHRLMLNADAEADAKTPLDVLQTILDEVPPPILERATA